MGTERRQRGSCGRRKAAETMGTGRQAERWKQRPAGPQDMESRGPPYGLAEEGSQRGGGVLEGTHSHPDGHAEIQVDASTCCPGTAPGPAAMLPLASPTLPSSAPNATLTLGLTLRGVDTRPVSPWHLLSLPAAHTPPVQPPCLPAVPALSNGAVWLQALILHRARPEAPTQHSCPQWRLPAQGPASCPATHRPGANRDTLPCGGPKQRP